MFMRLGVCVSFWLPTCRPLRLRPLLFAAPFCCTLAAFLRHVFGHNNVTTILALKWEQRAKTSKEDWKWQRGFTTHMLRFRLSMRGLVCRLGAVLNILCLLRNEGFPSFC